MAQQQSGVQTSIPVAEFAVVDVETTGTIHDGKITEIAIIVHDGTRELDRFTTLLNPGRRIDPYVARLTGITDRMVADAPLFEEHAQRILEMTRDRIFVAHNVSFDYAFLKMEFRSMGMEFKRDTLDSIDICRRIIPDLPSYSLKKLCTSIGIPMNGHHRALDDTEATALLFAKLYGMDIKTVFSRVKADIPDVNIPPNLPSTQLEGIPESTGVYYFHDADDQILYIGKSVDLRKRIFSHFHPKEKKKWAELWRAIHSITFEETGSELAALLLESQQIKQQQPRLNVALKMQHPLPYSIFEGVNDQGYVTFSIRRRDTKTDSIIDLRGYREGERLLIRTAERFKLCRCLMGLQQLKGNCFQHQIKECDGARMGLVSAEEYNARAARARQSMSITLENLLIVSAGRHADEYALVQVEQGRYMGYGFIAKEDANGPLDIVLEHIRPQEDNPDAQRIIRNALFSGKQGKRLRYRINDDGTRTYLA
ncbi:MAG: GIY-YIG nuclease family protein [Flavobacteriales bacterium]|nr:GIY-YIG nuclease family protein [Flavobacteriales bacterium]